MQNPLNDSYPELIYRTDDLGKYNERGELVFVSRKDYQIKHMGHRIELGEIEVNVNMPEGIKSACCVYDDNKERIVLYYVGDIDKKQRASYLFYYFAGPKFILYIFLTTISTYIVSCKIGDLYKIQSKYLDEHKDELSRKEKKNYKAYIKSKQ